MKQLAVMAWKEWREVRIFLWIAMGVFIVLPAIEAMEWVFRFNGHFTISSTPWVVVLGGILAVLVAVGTTCRDLREGIADFWQSRPVGPVRWMLVKYLIGVATVLFACGLPLLLELWIDGPQASIPLTGLYPLPFLLFVLYSVGFLSGTLVRRPAHAAMLAVAAMLLVYFLPLIIPPLKIWNGMALTPRPSGSGSVGGEKWDVWFWEYCLGMTAAGLALLGLSLAAIHRGWRIESNRKLMYGAISAAILILLLSASYQVGTNLPILAEADLPVGVNSINNQVRFDGRDGYLLVEEEWIRVNGTFQRSDAQISIPIHLDGLKFTFGTPQRHESGNLSGLNPWEGLSARYLHRTVDAAPGLPGVYYSLDGYPRWWGEPHPTCNLFVVEPANNRRQLVTSVAQFQEPYRDGKPGDVINNPPAVYAWKDRLYILGPHLTTLDISDARNPRVISDEPVSNPLEYFPGSPYDRPDFARSFSLPSIPGLLARQRLELTMKALGLSAEFDGEYLCPTELDEYRLTKLDDNAATFESAGHYQQSLLATLLESPRNTGLTMFDGLAFSEPGYWQGSTLNPCMNVYTTGAGGLQLSGHFAAPYLESVYPLPDGRAIVLSAKKIYLVGLPAATQAEVLP